MLQYLIILLDDMSTSYCHYSSANQKRLISLNDLRRGIRFSMLENLMIQFVYPDYELPQKYRDEIDTIDHNKIVSSQSLDKTVLEESDVIVLHDWTILQNTDFGEGKSYVLRTDKQGLFEKYSSLKVILGKVDRLNVVIKDVETFTDRDFESYKMVLKELSTEIEKLYVAGKSPQLNLLTDRMMLSQMNNCGAGESNITLAPNGKFYVCPGFYYEDEADSVGDLDKGLDIKNKQLYRLDHAPICRHCDAWQCKRCIWLNRKTTLEVNTPSHEQCVIAHIERSSSKTLLENIRQHGSFLPDAEIKEIDYLDPFDKREEWERGKRQ